MQELMSMLVASQVLARDLHYESKGNSFYGLHLLADRCKDGIDDFLDRIRECYYLGELKTIPPCECAVLSDAIALVNNARQSVTIVDGMNNTALVLRLAGMCANIIGKIESLKSDNTYLSGTISILDAIGQKMQENFALLDRSALAQ